MKIVKVVKNSSVYYVREMVFISTFRKMLSRLILYMSLLIVAFLLLSLIQYIGFKKDVKQNSVYMAGHIKKDVNMKYILMWKPSNKNKYHRNTSQFLDGQTLFHKQNCKFTNCFVTYDKSLLQTENHIDAVVFNVRDIENIRPKDVNLTRHLNQRYIFHSLRPSESFPVCSSYFDNFFNWTWTYKLNSDVSQPLIDIYDANNKLIGPRKTMKWISKFENKSWVAMKSNKTKAVAWLVTKCKTRLKYQEFVNEMKKELVGYNYSIDIYGPCGDKKCPKGHIINCFKLIEKKYYFQMILEEAFVEDYMSELMAYAMSHFTIPIVLGSSNYRSFLPPGSYINANIFDIKKLGAIIDFLIKYPVTYKYFFDWKNYYYYTTKPRNHICDLCTKLNIPVKQKIYTNFRKWWNPNFKNICPKKKN